MLKIRLQKIGKKNDPSYRIALVEHTTSPHGKYIELLGTYNPKLKQKQFKKERIEYWLTKGAQASPTVHNLMINEKIINGEKVKAWKPKQSKAEPSVIPGEGGKKETETPVEPVKIEETPKAEISASIEETKPQEMPVIDTQEKKE